MLLTPLKEQKAHLEKMGRHCSRDPCHKLGGLGWREGRGHTLLQTLGAVVLGLLPHSSPTQPNMQRRNNGFMGEECIAIFIIHSGNGLPGVHCAYGQSTRFG